MDNPNLGTSKEDTKKLESFFRSKDITPMLVEMSQLDVDSYFNTHEPDLERTKEYFSEPSDRFRNMTQEEIETFKRCVNGRPVDSNPEFVPNQEYISSTDTPPLCVGISQTAVDEYINTHAPDLIRPGKGFGEIAAIDLSNLASLLTMAGFSFQVIKEENGNPKIVIKVNEDIKDLTIELKTGGRIIGVNTFVNTGE